MAHCCGLREHETAMAQSWTFMAAFRLHGHVLHGVVLHGVSSRLISQHLKESGWLSRCAVCACGNEAPQPC